jgi:hypothetical protein
VNKAALLIMVLLLCVVLSCTQTKAKEGNEPVQNISEATNIQPLPVNAAPVDDYVIIGGFKTTYKLSRSVGTYDIMISEDESMDLSGIEQLVDVGGLRLYLWGKDNIDFSPLKSLSKLVALSIWGYTLTGIPDLSGITSLVSLKLDNNSLISMNGLERVPQLRKLYIQDACIPVLDTSALRYLQNLQEFYIYNSSVNIDFSNLSNSPDLLEIYFSNCGELDLTGIGQLNQLKKLRLEIGVSEETGKQSVFRNIEEIGRMTGLTELYLDEVITSVDFLANNVNLERLELVAGKERLPGAIYYTGAPLPLDVAPLGNLKNLKYLAIRGFELINAHVLASLPELKTLDTKLFSGDH